MYVLKDIEIFLFQTLEDNKTLGEYGFTSSSARAQAPATIGLVYKKEGKCYETNTSRLPCSPLLQIYHLL